MGGVFSITSMLQAYACRNGMQVSTQNSIQVSLTNCTWSYCRQICFHFVGRHYDFGKYLFLGIVKFYSIAEKNVIVELTYVLHTENFP